MSEVLGEIINALNWLRSNGNLNNDEYDTLKSYYMTDNRDVEIIKSELRSFYQSRGAVVNKVNSIKTMDDDIEIIEIEESILNNSQKVNLSSVSDLKKDGENYIKLNYQDGSVRIIENNLDLPGQDLFNMLLEKYSNQEKFDVTTLFEDMTKGSIEIKLYDFNDISNNNVYNQLSDFEKQGVNIVRSTYPDKQVISGPSDNIYIIREIGKEDFFVKVENKNGIYQVRPIVEIGLDDTFPLENENSDEVSTSTFGHQKTLGGHPSAGKMSWDDKNSAFINVLFFIFFGGVGIGVTFMTILNFLSK